MIRATFSVAFSARIQTTRPPAGAPLRNTRNSHGAVSVSVSHQQKRKKQGRLTTAGAILKNRWYEGFAELSELPKPFKRRFLRHLSTQLLWLSAPLRGRIAVHDSFVAIGSPTGAVTFIQWPHDAHVVDHVYTCS
jgi:hypothetical protein